VKRRDVRRHREIKTMPGCVFRTSGEAFDVDAFLRDSAFNPVRVYRKGEPGSPKSRGPVRRSGFNVRVSDVEDNIEEQVPDALHFLEEHEKEILRLLATHGVEGAVLDFGSTFRDVGMQSERFPASIVRSAGALGLSLEVSLYPPSNPESESP